MTAELAANPLARRLALLRAPGIGPITYIKLLRQYPDLGELFTPSARKTLPAATARYLAAPDWAAVQRDLDWAANPGRHILAWEQPDYPRLLREIPDPPPLLFVQGRLDCLHSPQLALVGSRNPSAGGRETAQALAAQLAARGMTITSGLAHGIDSASHHGALAHGGSGIAVMGTGPDRIYPAANRELAQALLHNGGALVSEFSTGQPPRREHFPRRNRIISGLSLGTLVIEAALRSGSLITARLAAEQGREVFAVPGSIHNPLARGCHALLRQGAKLVETVDDILEELSPLASYLTQSETSPAPVKALPEPPNGPPEQKQLLELIGYDSVSVDQLVERSGLTAAAVSSMLLVLELEGYVVSRTGGRYVRIETRG